MLSGEHGVQPSTKEGLRVSKLHKVRIPNNRDYDDLTVSHFPHDRRVLDEDSKLNVDALSSVYP
jgi:hypothetical protein